MCHSDHLSSICAQDSASQCPDIVSDLRSRMETSLVTAEPGYSKYYNFPSCSAVSGDWADRYWGANLPALLDIKDGENIDLLGQECNESPRVGPRQRV